MLVIGSPRSDLLQCPGVFLDIKVYSYIVKYSASVTCLCHECLPSYVSRRQKSLDVYPFTLCRNSHIRRNVRRKERLDYYI